MNKKKIKNKKGGSTFFDKLTKAITESFNNTGVSGPIEPSEHETTPDNQINIDMNGKEAVIELQKLLEPFYSDVTQIARSEEDITNQTDSSAAATVAINKESLNKAQDALQTLTKIAGNALTESQVAVDAATDSAEVGGNGVAVDAAADSAAVGGNGATADASGKKIKKKNSKKTLYKKNKTKKIRTKKNNNKKVKNKKNNNKKD